MRLKSLWLLILLSCSALITASGGAPKDAIAGSSDYGIPSARYLPGDTDSLKFAISTNLLYDAALIPNVGFSVYWSRGWSAGLNIMGAWWKNDRHDRFWRVYGGEMSLSRHFDTGNGSWTGCHIGVYAQLLTYDFKLGRNGYLGGKPGGGLFDCPTVGAGVEYGYVLSLGRSIAIDFNIGVGWLGGKYMEYTKQDGHYVWTRTRRYNWFGPTKAGITLMWRFGCGTRKGGGR